MSFRDDPKERAKVDAWNARHAVGTRVTLLEDGGKTVATRTQTEAQVLSGHTAVIWLEGVSGCYDLERVTQIEVTCIGCGARNVEVASHDC